MPRGSGRRPKPTAQKIIEGNPGKRKLNDKEPQPAAGEPAMPDGLGAVAQVEWKAIVPELLRIKVLSKLDGKALGGYCAAYERWLLAEKDVAKYGITIEEPVIDSATGFQRKLRGRYVVRLKRNPAITTSNDAMKMMKSFLVEFGMTPASRSRLKTEDGEKAQDPADQYFVGNNVTPIRSSK
jgi:P27 family predicted phage terminase small subunit